MLVPQKNLHLRGGFMMREGRMVCLCAGGYHRLACQLDFHDAIKATSKYTSILLGSSKNLVLSIPDISLLRSTLFHLETVMRSIQSLAVR